MNIKFKYNGKIWNPKNPEKKLKQLGITWDDVEIIKDEIIKEDAIEYQNPVLYVFKNHHHIILSIHDNLEHLKNEIKDIESYKYVGTQEYDSNGNGKW